jgi:hypothetical protein
LSALTDVFRRAGNARRAYLASFPTIPAPDEFFEAARGLLATDPKLVGLIQKHRQRKKLTTDPVKTLREKERVLVEIWRAIARASNYDPDTLLLSNNRAAILGALRALMAFLVAKGVFPGSDPEALKGAQAFLITARREANKLRRQIHGASRPNQPADDGAMAWLRATAPLVRQRKPKAPATSIARWLFALACKEGITKWVDYESLRVSAYKNRIPL